MDITVRGRKCEVSDRFTSLVEEKVRKLERLDDRVDKVAVTVTKEAHARLPEDTETVELTFSTVKGRVIRAEASSADRYSALDDALARLAEQLRRVRDRRKVHHGRRSPRSVHDATKALADLHAVDDGDGSEEPLPRRSEAGIDVEGDGPLVVREKWHTSEPMSLACAIEQMELVGHDFFLFVDVATREPSVAYRRRGYDFGVIHLAGMEVTVTEPARSTGT